MDMAYNLPPQDWDGLDTDSLAGQIGPPSAPSFGAISSHHYCICKNRFFSSGDRDPGASSGRSAFQDRGPFAPNILLWIAVHHVADLVCDLVEPPRSRIWRPGTQIWIFSFSLPRIPENLVTR